jgi:molybdenum cofactor synthesis domain-containing protein
MTTACVIIIGNEILSGRTQDKNLAWLAKELNQCGVQLREARVIPDIEQTIIETVNVCRQQFTYVFTTGGIGPTHDDITTATIAKAFGVNVENNTEATAILTRHYGQENLNAARLKMAGIPVGATLIYNPVSAAPGFQLGNVYVLPGVPSIMQAMFDNIRHSLKGGTVMLSRTLSAYITEGIIAEKLTAIAAEYEHVDIGSYPFMRQSRLGTSLVARSLNEEALNATYEKIKILLLTFTPDVIEDDLST